MSAHGGRDEGVVSARVFALGPFATGCDVAQLAVGSRRTGSHSQIAALGPSFRILHSTVPCSSPSVILPDLSSRNWTTARYRLTTLCFWKAVESVRATCDFLARMRHPVVDESSRWTGKSSPYSSFKTGAEARSVRVEDSGKRTTDETGSTATDDGRGLRARPGLRRQMACR